MQDSRTIVCVRPLTLTLGRLLVFRSGAAFEHVFQTFHVFHPRVFACGTKGARASC